MVDFILTSTLLLVLLNPFLLVIYLVDIVQKLDQRQFILTLVRAGLISSLVFCGFAVVGDSLFTKIIHVNFASFQIFGGIVFLLIGLKFVFHGPGAIEMLRGESKHLAGAIAMPILIGPGTISASVVIGKENPITYACGSIVFSVVICLLLVVILKSLHDYVRPRNEPLIERYIEIMGRISSLYVGSVAIEMIMQGTRSWIQNFLAHLA